MSIDTLFMPPAPVRKIRRYPWDEQPPDQARTLPIPIDRAVRGLSTGMPPAPAPMIGEAERAQQDMTQTASAAPPIASGSMPPANVPRIGPAQQRLSGMVSSGAPQLHGVKKVLDIIGQIAAPGVEQAVPGTPGNYRARLGAAKADAMDEQAIEDQNLQRENIQSQISDRTAQQREREKAANAPEKVPNPNVGHTVETADGIWQWNPESSRYDIRVGDLKKPASTPSFEQQTYDEWATAQKQAGKPSDRMAFDAARKPANSEQALSDYLAANKMDDTPQNRDKARVAMAGRSGQQPTEEDAKGAAQDILAHRLAPSQMAQLYGGFGTAAQKFKRMVIAEARKIDPNFDYEQAEGDYQFSKSPTFQSTVRYMGSVQESIPMVIQRANTLANGNVRSINALVNAGKNQFNNVDLKKFQTDRLLVADEIAKILQGGGTGSGTSDTKLEQASQILKDSDSPAAIAGTLADVNQLLGYRRTALTRGTYMDRGAAQGGATSQGSKGKADPLGIR